MDEDQQHDQDLLGDEHARDKTPEARAESAQERTRELADDLHRLQADEADDPEHFERPEPAADAQDE
jgi:hypothetical protein